jgi:hypothetical protein
MCFAPRQSFRIEQIGVDAHRRLGKFGLVAELEPARETEVGGGATG